MADGFADPYSSFGRGLTQGSQIGANVYGMMMQKAESKMKRDLSTLGNAFEMMNVKGLPDQKKVEIYNQTLVPIANRLNPKSKLTEITEWPAYGGQFAKRLKDLSISHKKGEIKDRDYMDSLNLISTEAREAGIKDLGIAGLKESAQRVIRRKALGLVPEAERPGPLQALEFEETGKAPKMAGVGPGGLSEVQSSEMLPSGLVQIVRKDGTTELVQPEEADKILIEQAEVRSAELQGLRSGEREEAKSAAKTALDSFKKLSSLRKNISNMDEGIAAIDAGAKSGVVEKRFPSIKAASLRLDNVQDRLGLDVIGNTTFGALSESELKFALSAALPTGLNETELRAWMVEKRDAQKKLMKYVEEAAVFLGTPGNNIADFLKQKRQEAPTGPAEAEAAAGMPSPAQPVTPVTQPQAIQIGTVEEGHRYLGGDPSQPSSWERVQ